ncbi:Photosystem II stability/assembly factor [Monoraphidium neglectum]|uniref:Photosystem II stability/assembly factor n=1 Tax=Monoraphidium neglectum TaxID=145388 RepID=A0A0D2KPZ1_9CHLO|nr:Photosystem II stability/assembly factor [Monoraphidium neglectum]KIY97643.1 Photosystem II stability/assembly factor [Monoraphidium neglectum]|eukprot:XP_013896663.1 Photosystem II stability/assembly factor [Monoraphidium neglectum]
MTWAPGQSYWQPHNRPAARRVQNMGFTPDGEQLWMSTRGGDVYFSKDTEGTGFETTKLSSRGFGVLDVGFASNDVAFACGGSGSLFKSSDGGKTWKRDKSTDSVAGNLYSVRFFGNKGFILGNDGILLRYIGNGAASGSA